MYSNVLIRLSIVSGSREVRTYPQAGEAAHAPGDAECDEQRDDRRSVAPSAPRAQLLLPLVVRVFSLTTVLTAVLSGLRVTGAHGHYELGLVLFLRQWGGGCSASA